MSQEKVIKEKKIEITRTRIYMGTLYVQRTQLMCEDIHLNGHSDTIRYLNFTNNPITIYKRDGTLVTLDPVAGSFEDNLLLICYRTLGGEQLINTLPGHESKVLDIVKHAIKFKNGKGYYYEEHILGEDIENARYGLYIRNADVVVSSVFLDTQVDHHCLSVQRIHNHYLHTNPQMDPAKTINVSLRLVDNTGDNPTMYGIFHNEIISLSPVEDPLLENGLYVTGLVHLVNGHNSLREDAHYTEQDIVDNKTPIKLYTSIIEAQGELAKQKGVNREYDIGVKNLDKEIEALKHSLELSKQKTAQLEQQRLEHRRTIEHDQQGTKQKLDLESMLRSHLQSIAETQTANTLARQEMDQIRLKHEKDMALLEAQLAGQKQKELAAYSTINERKTMDTLKITSMLLGGAFTLYKLFI